MSDSILQERARQLAQALPADRPDDSVLQVVEFVLGNERYAFETRSVREVRPLRQLTPVPCTPAHVLGIVNLRGQILSVIDIRRFFGLPQRGLAELDKMIVLHGGGMEFGVYADQVAGTRTVPAADLQATIATFSGIQEAYLRGVTTDGLVVLDAARLLADESLVVQAKLDG
jgi:purine-binding chemotaxis protein CheW